MQNPPIIKNRPRIVCLSNVHDQQYHQLRGEAIAPCLSSPKRRDLFRCLELATDREVIVLSAPPKALERRKGKWLVPVETRFSTHRQLFCSNWDGPKLRVPISWWFYAWHVAGQVRDGDLVLLDNYELIYVLAACLVRLRRRVTFVLEFEDGKHLICRGLDRILSGLAESIARRFIQGALLAHPGLGSRLPSGIPTVVVPGFVVPNANPPPFPDAGPVRFLYSGSLDVPRGVDMLLRALEMLPEEGWQLDVTGAGPLAGEASRMAASDRFVNRLKFHGTLAQPAYEALVAQCHVGLNCQRTGDPISSVTFPSKVFSYLSAGLAVLSTRASNVPEICSDACLYLDADTPESLSKSLGEIIADPVAELGVLDTRQATERFSIEGTAARLRPFFAGICNLQH